MNIGFLFDLDGVLIDSETQYTRIWNEINDCFPTGVSDFAYRIKGTTLESILANYFSPDVRNEVINMLYARENAMQYEYCNGAESILSELGRRKIKKAIVTSSKKDKMSHLLQQHPEIELNVDTIIDADSVTKSKPDPQGYLLGAGRIGVPPEYCVVVEDSLQGIQAGKAAECYVVGLTGTFGRKALEGEADILLDSLEELDVDFIINEIYNKNL